MALSLPISCFLIFNIIKKEKNNFSVFLLSICLTFIYLYVVTEVLSLFNSVTEINIKFSWIIFLILLAIINIFKIIKKNKKDNSNNKNKINLKEKLNQISFWHILVILFVIILIVMGIKTTPYNWDSMTYHLPRIMHWVQNGSIDHYATNIVRQVASPAFAEIADLHIYLLSDSSDIFVNLLQTLSFIVNGFIVYFIAKKIGCDKKFSILAMILAFSMPIGFAEALSTQVDNFSALWCLIFTYIILDFLNKDEKIKLDKDSVLKIICLGLSLGFGYLTKPTILFSDGLFTLYLIYMCIRRKDKIKDVIISILIVGITTLIIIMPMTLRNLKTFNAFSDPIAGQKQIVQVDKKSYFVMNFLKNLLWNYQTFLIDGNNDNIKNWLNDLGNRFNININDESISEAGIDYNLSKGSAFHHDYAVNPLIMWSLSIAILSFIIGIKNNKEKKSIIFCIISFISFTMFLLIMRFQVWGSRYEISFLELLCPSIGLLFNIGLNDKYKKIIIGVICGLALISMINQFNFHLKYVKGLSNRNEEYFRSNMRQYNNYYEISNLVNKTYHKNVGLEITEDTYEYPFFTMIENVDKIEHVNVQNNTSIYYNYNFKPDIVISNIIEENSQETKIYNKNIYRKINNINGYNIYELEK